MFKLESYITPVILSYVEKYVKNFKPEQSQVKYIYIHTLENVTVLILLGIVFVKSSYFLLFNDLE